MLRRNGEGSTRNTRLAPALWVSYDTSCPMGPPPTTITESPSRTADMRTALTATASGSTQALCWSLTVLGSAQVRGAQRDVFCHSSVPRYAGGVLGGSLSVRVVAPGETVHALRATLPLGSTATPAPGTTRVRRGNVNDLSSELMPYDDA